MTRKYFGTDGVRGVANQYPMDGVTAMKLGQAIYEKEQAEAASPGAEAPKADDDVVDAEFSEVDDNKA